MQCIDDSTHPMLIVDSEPVLVVDSEPDMRATLSHALSQCGYCVVTAASGSEALVKFKRQRFKIVITDSKMPEMSGLEVLGAVKKISPKIPVILTSENGTIENAVDAIQKGASDYILKPISPKTLKAAVNKARLQTKISVNHINKQINATKSTKIRQIITQDSMMLNILKLAKTIAPSNANVLIQGESGTGKEMLASFIHQHGFKNDRPYVAVNCAALPDGLAESELFGHEKGSFTGAFAKKIGRFEMAIHGTLVLDEISEMPLPLQAKLLRVLQEKEIDRVGGNKPIPIDSRIIAISNVDLKKAVNEGKFREDLFYRINVIPFTIPPLRRRKDDIPLLAKHFLKKYLSINRKDTLKINEHALSILKKYNWKGNIRELENTIERAVLLADKNEIYPEHLLFEDIDDSDSKTVTIKAGISVKEMEKELIFETLKEVKENRTHAAELLGISIRTLRNKLREYKNEKGDQ
jgi:DNA-binding NtrC family response regulator